MSFRPLPTPLFYSVLSLPPTSGILPLSPSCTLCLQLPLPLSLSFSPLSSPLVPHSACPLPFPILHLPLSPSLPPPSSPSFHVCAFSDAVLGMALLFLSSIDESPCKRGADSKRSQQRHGARPGGTEALHNGNRSASINIATCMLRARLSAQYEVKLCCTCNYSNLGNSKVDHVACYFVGGPLHCWSCCRCCSSCCTTPT